MQLNFKSESELVRYCEEYRAKKDDYNGWTNYATWRINLELVDPLQYEKSECDIEFKDLYELSETIKSDIEDYLSDNSGGICLDYAEAFISQVNWYEIAEHIASDNPGIVVLDSDKVDKK